MRGIERLVAALLLVGAVAGVALIPRFLAGPHATAQVGLAPNGAAGPTVVHAAGLPPTRTARPGPSASPFSGPSLAESPLAVDRLALPGTTAAGSVLGTPARSRVLQPDTGPLQQALAPTVTIATPPASSPPSSPAPSPPSAPAPSPPPSPAPSPPSPPSAPSPPAAPSSPATPPSNPVAAPPVASPASAPAGTKRHGGGHDAHAGHGYQPAPSDQTRLPLTSLHVPGAQDEGPSVQDAAPQPVQTETVQHQAGVPVVAPPLPSPNGDRGDGTFGQTGSSSPNPTWPSWRSSRDGQPGSEPAQQHDGGQAGSSSPNPTWPSWRSSRDGQPGSEPAQQQPAQQPAQQHDGGQPQAGPQTGSWGDGHGLASPQQPWSGWHDGH